MEHEHLIEKIMEHYEEALEELMDAENYAKLAGHTERMEDRRMYYTLAKQELEHEAMILASGDRLAADAPKDHSIHPVWDRLKKHLHHWRENIERKIAAG